ncbi:MAG TPA: N-acetylmuramoyl-L-alanine amidase [Gemmatimonadales bacterium]
MTPEPFDPREELVVAPPLPAVPEVDGLLAIRVVYPPAGTLIGPIDSSFVFGSAGSGRASMTLNGDPVRVWANGTWLAWVKLPAGPEVRLDIVAWRGADSARVNHMIRRRVEPEPSRAGGVWVDTTSFSPRGRIWWSTGEPILLVVRAVEGASIRLLLPDRPAPIELAPLPARSGISDALRAFDRDTTNLLTSNRRDSYVGVLSSDAIGPPLGPVTNPANGPLAGEAILEVARNGDTLRVQWPIQVTRLEEPLPVVELDDDPRQQNNTDRITVGRALPGGTYHWFFPTGTRAVVTGRINADLRLRLSSGHSAWINAAEATLLPPGVGLEPAVLGSITATPANDRVSLRLPLSWRAPYRVEEHPDGVTLSFHTAVGDPNWIRHGPRRGPLASVTWRQRAADIVDVTATLRSSLWGYRTRWDRDDLILELRTRPAPVGRRPLRGRLIVVDPGHPPQGATGPSGLTEAEANLGVALVLERLLAQDGARVVMTRRDDRPVELWPRVKLADSLDADILVSIHNNALPDGLNPFTNNGSSVFYFHPRSIPLARAIQRELTRRLPLRELGIARGDLALVRGTWMPSVLVEGMFMLIPEQEAALRTEAGRRAYAEAVRAGIRAFFAGEADVMLHQSGTSPN